MSQIWKPFLWSPYSLQIKVCVITQFSAMSDFTRSELTLVQLQFDIVILCLINMFQKIEFIFYVCLYFNFLKKICYNFKCIPPGIRNQINKRIWSFTTDNLRYTILDFYLILFCLKPLFLHFLSLVSASYAMRSKFPPLDLLTYLSVFT